MKPEHTYNDGSLYRLARGHAARRKHYDDVAAATHAIADLAADQISASQMLRLVEREMRIRFYKPRSVKAYCSALRQFLGWLGAPPAEANKELLRQYLEGLVDGGASASWVATNVAAIRTAFDKMCGATITTGLVTPRRRVRPPRVLSREQVIKLLECIVAPHHRVMASLIYATGMRITELIRLRGRDIELERGQIIVWRGKGDKRRSVPLPSRLRSFLEAQWLAPNLFVFRRTGSRRHLGPRGLQRAVQQAARVANLGAGVTCHTLRHSFATHLLEDGMDVRVIQSLLGHERLETTQIYTHVASLKTRRVGSPLDSLALGPATRSPPGSTPTFRLTLRPDGRTADVELILRGPRPATLSGIEVEEQRPGWICMRLPPPADWRCIIEALPLQEKQALDDGEFYERLRLAVADAFVKRKQAR